MEGYKRDKCSECEEPLCFQEKDICDNCFLELEFPTDPSAGINYDVDFFEKIELILLYERSQYLHLDKK